MMEVRIEFYMKSKELFFGKFNLDIPKDGVIDTKNIFNNILYENKSDWLEIFYEKGKVTYINKNEISAVSIVFPEDLHMY